jgi:hypothetical protein
MGSAGLKTNEKIASLLRRQLLERWSSGRVQLIKKGSGKAQTLNQRILRWSRSDAYLQNANRVRPQGRDPSKAPLLAQAAFYAARSAGCQSELGAIRGVKRDTA